MLGFSRHIWFVACLLLWHACAWSQNCQTTRLYISIKDSQGAAVFDAAVHLGSESGETGVQNTDANGQVVFSEVHCGSQLIRVSKPGFEEVAQTIQIEQQPDREITISLEPKRQQATVEVKETLPPVQQTSTHVTELQPAHVKTLPGNPPTVTQTLPLIPGIVRSPDGELKIDGSGEQRSSLVVNQSDVTDPATGKFGQTVPIDSVETINVYNTPFLAQYGRFTQSVVAVDTKRGGDKWHGELNDPFPDFRVRSFHIVGIRNETPHGVIGGPLIRDRLYFNSSLQYYLDKVPSRTLGFPHNESKQESINSFTQLDFIASPKQVITATLHITPQHINFVNPDYFNPQPTTPTIAQHNYIGTLADHFGVLGGTLDNSISIQRFDAFIGAQGDADYVLTPGGNQGNYFARQNREAKRTEWLEIWSPRPVRFLGTHLFKLGNSLTNSNNQGRFTFFPVSILDSTGQLLQDIRFTTPNRFNRTDFEITAYAQDHWSPTAKLSFDYGLRLEHQKLASSLRIAPRAGVAITPFPNERTVFRAGYGQFYDHIPLDVYSFGNYPRRTITDYAPDGSIIDSYFVTNVIGSITGPRSFLIRGQRVAGAFSPRGVTWNLQAEHSFSRLLRVRAVYTNNRSVGLIVLDPETLGPINEIVLNGDGQSSFRQAEFTAKLGWEKGQQLVFSYTRSRTEGNLNGFDNYLGNYPAPIVRPDLYSNLPGDIPNRFLLWGHLETHLWQLQFNPIIEYRNGFPYATYDQFQNYAGTPYADATRFPNFFSADARVLREFRINPKYGLRLSVTGFNLTNHFNALAIHNNIDDPQHGVFFGNYHRRYRFDFEVLF